MKPGKPQKKKSSTFIQLGIGGVFIIFIGVSYLFQFAPGIGIAQKSGDFIWSMVVLFPAAFILIGLFETWIDRSVVERHLGTASGPAGYFWVILLASTVMAPLIIALPLAQSLAKKGARLQLVIAFVSASTICRIPMTIFEASYLGIHFSLVRLLVSLPLVILFSELMGRFFSIKDMNL